MLPRGYVLLKCFCWSELLYQDFDRPGFPRVPTSSIFRVCNWCSSSKPDKRWWLANADQLCPWTSVMALSTANQVWQEKYLQRIYRNSKGEAIHTRIEYSVVKLRQEVGKHAWHIKLASRLAHIIRSVCHSNQIYCSPFKRVELTLNHLRKGCVKRGFSVSNSSVASAILMTNSTLVYLLYSPLIYAAEIDSVCDGNVINTAHRKNETSKSLYYVKSHCFMKHRIVRAAHTYLI